MNRERLLRGIFEVSRGLIEKRKLVLVGVGLFLFLVIQTRWFQEFYPFQVIEAKTIDLRYRLRPIQNPNPNIAIVGITPSSLDLSSASTEEVKNSPYLSEMQKPFSRWNREIYAEVLRRLIKGGASIVIFDIVFSGQTTGDKAFAEAIEEYQDRVGLGSMFSYQQGQGNSQAVVYITPEDALGLKPDLPIVGYANIWPDVDGVTRRGRYKSSLLREFGKEDDTEDLISLSALAVKKFLGTLMTPNYYRSNFINFSGPAFNYPIYPLEHVLVEKIWQSNPYHSGKLFEDKIVVVGPADEIFKDQHMTPLGMMLGVEIQSNMMATLLTSSWLREWTVGSNMILVAIVIALTLLAGLGISQALLKISLWGGIGFSFSLLVWWLFVKEGIVVAYFPPLLGFLGVSMTGAVLDFAAEQRERARVNRVLNRYVAPNVVQLILNEREAFLSSLKGTKRAVTVLFSDLRNFTSLTEGAKSEVLVSQLNDYFSRMVEIVLKRGGTLHKFIGDSLMAVWGDTHSKGLSQDAQAAVDSALEMENALKELNELWIQQAKPVLQMGIGIDHGKVVVGNVGHPERMEFTVLGNAVNTASRIEGETKRYQIPILVSEEVYQLTQPFFDYALIDEVVLRGKAQATKLYQPLGLKKL